MKRTTKYVALDVHQATTVTSVREESGRVLARSVLETHRPSIVEFFRGLRGAIHVVFEEGTQAQWLYDLIARLVDRVVCDRRGQARHGNKGDHVDADQLSELLRRGGLRSVYHGSAHRAALKELTRAYRSLVEDGMRMMLRIEALFRARAIPTRGTAAYQARRRAPKGFANMTAGHFVILSLLGIIFLFGNVQVVRWLIAGGSVVFVLFMMALELLVALLQAYIFALLTSVFIGLMQHEH